MTLTPKLRYTALTIFLLINSIIVIYALAYPLNPNRIIETWLFTLLLLRFLPRLGQLLIGVSSVIILFYYPTAAHYGRPSLGIVSSLISTNMSEATEYLTIISWQTYLFGIILTLIPILTIYIYRRTPILKWRWYWSLPLILIIVLMVNHTASKENTISTFPLRIQPVEFIADLLYFQPKAYFEELATLKENLNKPDRWQIKTVQQPYKNYVLVIGESVRADYMHLYGFKYNNTPFLDKHSSLVMDHMWAAGPNTIVSLLHGLTLSHGSGISMATNIISLAKKAGMETSWLSNQGALGEYDTSISSIGHRADHVNFLKSTGYNFGDNPNDDQLLPLLQQTLAQPSQKNRLIVLHIMGSHANPCERLSHPPTHYVNNMNSNCYIDTIKQTDNFLKQIYNQLQETNQPFSLLYFGDHGLSHDKNTFEKNSLTLYSSILRHNDKFIQNYHVPLIVINSDQTDIRRNSAQRSGLFLIDGLAQWMGITSEQLPYSKDFFSQKDSKDIQVLDSNQQLQSVQVLQDDPLPDELK